MKLTRKQLRKLIEATFINDPTMLSLKSKKPGSLYTQTTTYAPDDVRAAAQRAKEKDAQALGLIDNLDVLLQSDDPEDRKQGRMLSTTLGLQPELSPFEELTYDELDPGDVFGPSTPIEQYDIDLMLNNPIARKAKKQLTKEFMQYLHSHEGMNDVDKYLKFVYDFYGYLPPRMNFNNLIRGTSSIPGAKDGGGFGLDKRIKRITHGHRAPNRFDIYMTNELNKIAKEKFNEDFFKVFEDRMSGKSFPLALTESELKQLMIEAFKGKKGKK
tara:strand:- start:566 stop:1378 length:813 start_codon:yes stop_codon:yes gene_type:complete